MKAYVVDSAAVRSNLQQLQTRAGSAVLWAVLKGDGYGLGLLPMAAICREAGVTHFAVTEVSEVSRLRAGGFADASILMLRPTSEQDELRQLLQLGAILTVSSQNDAAVLNGVAQELGVQAEVHVKIDTGMGRYGFLPDELDQLLPIFRYMPGLHVTGIYTHLHSAFCSQKATIAQAEAFQRVLDQLHASGCETGMAHMLNSAGLPKYPQYAMDGRFAQAIGRRPANSSLTSAGILVFRMSPKMISRFSFPAIVSASTGWSVRSTSTATTFFACRHSCCVSGPMPGPTSSTPQVPSIPASSTIFCGTQLCVRKFCPLALEKWNPCRASSALISVILQRSIKNPPFLPVSYQTKGGFSIRILRPSPRTRSRASRPTRCRCRNPCPCRCR